MEFDEGGYIPISDRIEWQGIAPLCQPEPSTKVVAIRTDPDHADLLGTFWAALRSGERSQRVLDLSEEIILNYNSAHFSVWAWRWECLSFLAKLDTDEGVAAEVEMMRRVATDNPKNYQLWNHRRKFALHRGGDHAGGEMDFSAACLSYDQKNYHAWAHRQAILTAFGSQVVSLWADELAVTEKFLRQDLRNNSAWTQRFFILAKMPRGKVLLGTPQEVYDREIDFVIVKINLAPHNEAAWGYLRALLGSSSCSNQNESSREDQIHEHASLLPGAPSWALGFEARAQQLCYTILESDSMNVPALEFLADYYVGRAEILKSLMVSKGKKSGEENVFAKRSEALVAAREAAIELYSKLLVAEPSRTAFYNKRLRDITAVTN
jgi:protein farnesyltransferase/geranylgeranyltransferase type-1 subunit alpha